MTPMTLLVVLLALNLVVTIGNTALIWWPGQIRGFVRRMLGGK